MHVLVTCKFNEDPIKTECAINRTSFSSNKSMGKFFVTQGQVTSKQIFQSGHNSNFVVILCLSWLLASLTALSIGQCQIWAFSALKGK